MTKFKFIDRKRRPRFTDICIGLFFYITNNYNFHFNIRPVFLLSRFTDFFVQIGLSEDENKNKIYNTSCILYFLFFSSKKLGLRTKKNIKLGYGTIFFNNDSSSVQHRQEIGGDICLTTLKTKETFVL